MTDKCANQAVPVNAPIASWFQVVHPWRRVTEQRRWADSRIVKPMMVILLCLVAGCIASGCAVERPPRGLSRIPETPQHVPRLQSLPSGSRETQSTTVVPVVWEGADVFVLPQEAGFQWERLELKGGKFRYWLAADVKIENSPRYPIEGVFELKGDQLVLSNGESYTVRSFQGTRTLWRPKALDYWDHHGIISVYGILLPIDRATGKATLRPLFTTEQWDTSRKQVKRLERKN